MKKSLLVVSLGVLFLLAPPIWAKCYKITYKEKGEWRGFCDNGLKFTCATAAWPFFCFTETYKDSKDPNFVIDEVREKGDSPKEALKKVCGCLRDSL